MANETQKFRNAVRKWEYLYREREFSCAPELGMTAIVYALYEDLIFENPNDPEPTNKTRNEYFEKEAHEIAGNIIAQGGEPYIVPSVTADSFSGEVMGNPEVANVIVISHGDFSAFFTDDGHLIDWESISKMSEHLKLGYFEQRFCGNFRRHLSVPCGLFAVSSARNVLASKGKGFSPELDPSHEADIQPVAMRRRLSYRYIRDTFPKDPPDKDPFVPSQNQT